MRLVVVLVCAACATDPTPEDRLVEIEAINQVDCGAESYRGCPTDAAGQQAVACMNDALASGTRASFGLASQTWDMFDKNTLWFTIDHEVHVFDDYPTGGGISAQAYAVEKPTCDGPFHAAPFYCPFTGSAGTGVALDGCPAP